MLVVIASDQDEVARSLVARWEARGACLLTPADLSIAGWRHYSSALPRSTAAVGGRAIDVREIDGVLTRLPCVTEYDLPHINPTERPYIAAEMSAFLLAWLSSLGCPVINRATPMGLSGPNWRREQWAHCAARIGIPVVPVWRAVRSPASTPPGLPAFASISVTVVGDRCFGAPNAEVESRARRVARAAGVEILEAEFSGPAPESFFLGARVQPATVSGEVADALLEYFERGLA